MMDRMDFQRHNMLLRYDKINNSFGMYQLSPGENGVNQDHLPISPNFHLTVAGDNYGIHSGIVTGGSWLPQQSQCVSADFAEDFAEMVYVNAQFHLQITVQLQFFKNTNVIRQINTVKNTGKDDITLTHFSSMHVQGIATDGLLPWYDNNKVRVHSCYSTWEGECQWRTASLEELGLFPNSVHQCNSSIHINSIGSCSTARYTPTCVIEDIETGQVWYFQIESSSSWHYEIGHRKLQDGTNGTLYMLADCADEMYDGWYKTLKPNEEFTSAPVAFGCALGGFEEAIKELTKYRREQRKPANAWVGDGPLIYNDYMNALWGNPTTERLMPLIDKACAVGAEGFCIDAGWFGPKESMWGMGLGDWTSSDDRFGNDGIKSIIDYIRSKGMIAGLWLELEACQKRAQSYELPDEYFLMRHGKRIGGDRVFFDFRNPKVREYLHRRIDDLVAMGVGYFKNDYNQSTGVGDDKNGNSPADGQLENARAFYEFIDQVRAKHPTLILENCGGGGLRHDYGILSHFHLQSTSDQEEYYRYPSIITGILANILPEQAGIWAYPYPLLYLDNLENPDVIKTDEYVQSMKDGEQTVFNMVNGMCGNMYMSGRIEHCDEFNISLIREAVTLYKKERKFIHNAYPVWPTGMKRMNDEAFATQGLISETGDRMLLAVWRFTTSRTTACIDLSSWADGDSKVQMLYPSEPLGVEYCYNKGNRTLTVKLPKPLSARFFEIQLK